MVHEAEGVSKVLTGDLGGRRRGDRSWCVPKEFVLIYLNRLSVSKREFCITLSLQVHKFVTSNFFKFSHTSPLNPCRNKVSYILSSFSLFFSTKLFVNHNSVIMAPYFTCMPPSAVQGLDFFARSPFLFKSRKNCVATDTSLEEASGRPKGLGVMEIS